MDKKLETNQKFMLSIHEAAEYFGIGIKKMRRIAEDHLGYLSVYNGNRHLVIRSRMEKYLIKWW